MFPPVNNKYQNDVLSKAFVNLSLEKKKSLVEKILEDIKYSKTNLSPLEKAKIRLDTVTSWQPKSVANIKNPWIQKQYEDAKKNYNDCLHKKKMEHLCFRGNTLSLK